MKRQLLVLMAVAIFAAALTTNAFGQAGNCVEANVKFDFNVGDRTFPAGEYRIESVSRQSYNILQIKSVRDLSKNEFIVANHSNGQIRTPRLVFQKYGENYFLTAIFLDTDEWGYSIRPSRRQRESEKNLALASRETIEVRLAK
jgi:hypothetical protein